MMLSQVLKQLRQTKDITQAELAKEMHVTQQTVAKWECDSTYPNIGTLKELAKFFNVSIDFLLEMPQTAASPTIIYAATSFKPNQQELDHLKKYRALSVSGQNVVNATLEAMIVEERGAYVTKNSMEY